MKFVILFGILATFVVCAHSANHTWGVIHPKDYLIAKDKVTKSGIIGFTCSKKYVFKQNKYDALTISAIRVTDRKPKYTAEVNLLNGGIGSKGATLGFKSKRNDNINCLVEIWGR